MAQAFLWIMIPLIAFTVAYSLFTGNGPMFVSQRSPDGAERNPGIF